jgi:chromosome segregation ATPase
MKKHVTLVLTTLFLVVPVYASAIVDVDGYFRDDGTYVESHYRSDPDGLKFNNRSYDPGYNSSYNVVGDSSVVRAQYFEDCEDIYQEYRDEYEDLSDEYDEKIEESGGRHAPQFAIRGELAQLRSEKSRELSSLDSEYNDEARECIEEAQEGKREEREERQRERQKQRELQQTQKAAYQQLRYWHNGNSKYDPDKLRKLQNELGMNSTEQLVRYLNDNGIKDRNAELILEKLKRERETKNTSTEDKNESSDSTSENTSQQESERENLKQQIRELQSIVDKLKARLRN